MEDFEAKASNISYIDQYPILAVQVRLRRLKLRTQLARAGILWEPSPLINFPNKNDTSE